MSEWIKTGIYGIAAVMLTIVAMWTYPWPTVIAVATGVGKPIFEDLNPSDAASLEIVRIDEDLAAITTFKVERTKGGWCLPRNGNYPADAEEQMKRAATLLGNLIKDATVPSIDGSTLNHADFGVIEPEQEKVKVGQTGIGTLVKMKDAQGKELAALVIGDLVKGERDKRYVRESGKDEVFIAEVDVNELSTDFQDWITEDLLRIDPRQVREVMLDDYLIKVSKTKDGKLEATSRPQMKATVSVDDNNEWNLEQLIIYNSKNQPITSRLGGLEELDKARLGALRQALAGLTIVDVVPKPVTLSGDLEADRELLKDPEMRRSLGSLGCFLDPNGRLVSSSGEVLVRDQAGVEYVLRFGNPAGTDPRTGATRRYLLLTAQVDEKVSAEPQLQALPELPEEASGDQPDADKDKGKKDKGKKEKDKIGEEAKRAQIKKERERIENENKLARENWRKKLNAARVRVRELNGRFGPWYYVISDDVYKSIRLNRSDIIKEMDSAADVGFGIDAFRKLEREGLKKKE